MSPPQEWAPQKYNRPVERSSKVTTFFSLPTEIRLQIYSLLLVNFGEKFIVPITLDISNKDIGNENISDEDIGDEDVGDEDVGDEDVGDEDVGDEDVGDGDIGDEDVGDEDVGDEDVGDGDIGDTDNGIEDPRNRTMDPAILQTCKKIYHEANPILYSRNIFAIVQTEGILRFTKQIGLVNFKLIKELEISVPPYAQLSPWLGLLYLLAEEASGLRRIKIFWYSNCDAADSPRYWERGAWDWVRGLGDNILFVHALGKIQGLEELVLGGFYAKNWPAYLEERMGVRVVMPELRNDAKFDKMKLHIAEYQQGTENLIP